MPEPVKTLDDLRQFIIRERKRRGLNQSETAGLINHTQKWLSQFETGRVDPPASMVFRLALALGINLTATVAAGDSGDDQISAEDGL